MMSKGPLILVAVMVAIYGSFWLWYGGADEPMTAQEFELRLKQIEAASEAKGKVLDPHLMDGFRALATTDDGLEFFMVNLIKYRDRALYPPDLLAEFGADALAADARYSEKIAPFLIRNGNLPVYLSTVQGRFLHPEDATDWDRVAIVRYRSRRDMLNMVEQIAKADFDVAIHKWASIKRTQVFPTETVFDFVQVRLVVFAVLAVLGLVLHGLLSLAPGYSRR